MKESHLQAHASSECLENIDNADSQMLFEVELHIWQ